MRCAILTSIICLYGIGYLSGCANISKAKFPEPTANFQPNTTYDATYDQIWSSVMRVLERERIGISSSDKDGGRIVTDYVQGPTQLQALGLFGSITLRYNYAISLEKISQDKTKAAIICRLESMSEKVTWHEVSKDNKAIVTKLENWLYEQIEKSL
ncbi:MAG: outer membrane protein assembly factor BamC [Candidatus Glassbacteria bacterium]